MFAGKKWTRNEEGNLKGHIEELKQKCEAISREVENIGSKNQIENEEIEGTDGWGYIKKRKRRKSREYKERLKRIFKLPVNTSYTGIMMETRKWHAELRIQYTAMMLYQQRIQMKNQKSR